MTRTLSAEKIRQALRDLQTIEALTNAMRGSVRPPTPHELYPAAAAVDLIREMLFEVAIGDVAIEAVEVERAA